MKLNLSSHLKHLETVATEDAQGVKKAEEQYGSSWKKRGGVGAFMMLARKWDRIEKALDSERFGWDIFKAIEEDKRAEGIIDDIRDLRRYLLLVESEMRARGEAQAGHRDNFTGMEEPRGYQEGYD